MIACNDFSKTSSPSSDQSSHGRIVYTQNGYSDGTWVVAVDNNTIAVLRRPIADARVKTITDVSTFVLVSYGRINLLGQILRGKNKSRGIPGRE